jgi:hypothetical protein
MGDRSDSAKGSEVHKTYAAIKQPPLHPPAWVFGPVWTILYGYVRYTQQSQLHLLRLSHTNDDVVLQV